MASLAVRAVIARITGRNKPLKVTRADIESAIKKAGPKGYLLITYYGYMLETIPVHLILEVHDTYLLVHPAYNGDDSTANCKVDYAHATEIKGHNPNWILEATKKYTRR